MPLRTFESPLARATPRDLFAWHARPGAFERLCPPWQTIRIDQPAPVEDGSVAELRMKKGPLWIPWTALHRDVEPGRAFVDVQTAGPFSRWVHRHEFLASDDGALLRDRIDFRLPGGALGQALAGRAIDRDLRTTFAYRHETTARDLARHADFASRPSQTIALSGAGGLVGSALAPFLTTGGHRVLPLVRPNAEPTAPPSWATGEAIAWRPDRGLDAPESIGHRLDAVVHLAGESIASGRWTAARKERLRSSRVDATRHLVRSLARLDPPPRTLVCASAIGYYGSRGDTPLDESSARGDGFLAELSEAWEAAAAEAATAGIRLVVLRFGIILSPAGGALAKMLPAFRLGVGGRLGSGRQIMSWVSIDDAIGAVHRAVLDDRLQGPLNVVAPNPVTNEEFTKTLARALRRPAILPLPAGAARLAFGQMADEMLLASARVEPRRLTDMGFRFDDPELAGTLDRLLGRTEIAWAN